MKKGVGCNGETDFIIGQYEFVNRITSPVSPEDMSRLPRGLHRNFSVYFYTKCTRSRPKTVWWKCVCNDCILVVQPTKGSPPFEGGGLQTLSRPSTDTEFL